MHIKRRRRATPEQGFIKQLIHGVYQRIGIPKTVEDTAFIPRKKIGRSAGRPAVIAFVFEYVARLKIVKLQPAGQFFAQVAGRNTHQVERSAAAAIGELQDAVPFAEDDLGAVR